MNAQQLMAGKQWTLGKIRGHEISISPIFLVLIGVFVFLGLNSLSQLPYQLMWAPVLFGSILLHELGHAAATKKCGFGTSTIILHGFGGVAISRRSNEKPKDGIFIALAGPAVTAILAVASGLLWLGFGLVAGPEPPMALSVIGHFLGLMTLANIFWLVLNLLPIHPLDGGQALMNFFRKKGKSRAKATAQAAKVSLVAIGVTALITLFVFQVGGLFLILIFGYLGYMNYQILQQAQSGGGPGGPTMMRFRR